MRNADDARHELDNLLAIALANVEGMIDGIVAPTTSRLEAIAGALRKASELTKQTGRDGNR